MHIGNVRNNLNLYDMILLLEEFETRPCRDIQGISHSLVSQYIPPVLQYILVAHCRQTMTVLQVRFGQIRQVVRINNKTCLTRHPIGNKK